MEGFSIAAFINLIVALFWYLKTREIDRRHQRAIGHLGDNEKPELAPEEAKVLFKAYLQQQRWSFGLLCFSIALGICLAGLLVGRLVLDQKPDISLITKAVGFVGDLWLGKKAYEFYKVASERLESIMKYFIPDR